MNILIIGSGYIANNLIPHLEKKHQIYVLSKLSKDSESDNPTYVYNEILTHESIKKVIEQYRINVVINSIGIIKESKGRTFNSSHIETVKKIIDAIDNKKVKLLHISALGVGDNIKTKYFKSKEEAEKLITNSKIDYTIIRPSILWGRGDLSISYFAKLIRIFHIFPLFSRGKYLLQPIYIDDFSSFISKSLSQENYSRRIVEIAGPRTFMFKDIITILAKVQKTKVIKVSIPKWLSKLIARVGDLIPLPINTDQLIMLESGNYLKKRRTNSIFQITTPTGIERFSKEQ